MLHVTLLFINRFHKIDSTIFGFFAVLFVLKGSFFFPHISFIFITAGVKHSMAAVKRLLVLHYRVVYTFWSFGII